MKISNFNVQTVPLTFNDLKSDQKMSDAYLVSCLQECLLILTQLLPIYAQSPAVVELFHPIIDLIESIPMDTEIGEYIRNTIRKWRLIIEATTLRRKPLQLQARKALAIKTYNPKFHENYSVDRKSYDPDRELRDARKLKQEYKKEMKGAIRELRIEAAAATRSKIAQIKQKDVQYKRKMDKIRGNLAEQEGAMRGYERENKKAKFKLQKGKKSSESQ